MQAIDRLLLALRFMQAARRQATCLKAVERLIRSAGSGRQIDMNERPMLGS